MSTHQDEQPNITKQEIRYAKARLSDVVETFIESNAVGGSHELVAHKELHKSVLGLWWRMRPHITDLDVWEDAARSEYLEREQIWSGSHPQTGEAVEITGLRDIGKWMDRTSTVQHAIPGPNNASKTQDEQLRVFLPAEAAIEAGKLLLVLFKDLGLDVEVEDPQSGDAGFDYSDLLETGPPGDGEKPEIEGVGDD